MFGVPLDLRRASGGQGGAADAGLRNLRRAVQATRRRRGPLTPSGVALVLWGFVDFVGKRKSLTFSSFGNTSRTRERSSARQTEEPGGEGGAVDVGGVGGQCSTAVAAASCWNARVLSPSFRRSASCDNHRDTSAHSDSDTHACVRSTRRAGQKGGRVSASAG